MSIVTPMVRPMVRPMVTAMGKGGGQRTPAQLIQSLFAAGQQGFWLLFTDFASLSQDSAGALPYTALEQPVGLILDKSKGGGRGPELSPNGGTFDDATGWTITQSTSSISGGVLNVGAGSCDVFPSTASVVAGKSYEVIFTISNSTANYGIRILNKDIIGSGTYFPAGAQYITANGTYRVVCVALSNGSIGVNRVSGHTGTLQIDNFSVKEIPGNHASQPTSTARGVVSARVNLLQKTEALTDSYWVKAGVTVAAGAIAPSGATTAFTAQISATGTYRYIRPSNSAVGVQTIATQTVKYDGHRYLAILGAGSGLVGASFDLLNGAVDYLRAGASASITGLGGGFYRVSYGNAAGEWDQGYWMLTDGGASITGTASAGKVILYQPSLTAGTLASLPYQRVNTPTDYDAVGFPKYARIDGTDDNYTCAGGGSTSGFYYSDVIRPMGGAGTRRVIWSDRSGNNGYELAINTSDKLELSAGNGAAIAAVASTVSAALAEGKQYEVMDNGTVLSVQIDGSAAVTIARPVVTAGSSTITLYRGASTGYFNGQITEPIYRAGPPPSAYEREVIRNYQKQKAGL